MLWATVDSPWLHKIDSTLFAGELNTIREMDPTMALSSHLPAAPGAMIERLLASLEAAPTAQPFEGPDQAALEQMLVEMTTGRATTSPAPGRHNASAGSPDSRP